MRSLYRYQKEHFRKITVKKELYESLRKIANEKGISISQLLQILIDIYMEDSKDTFTKGSKHQADLQRSKQSKLFEWIAYLYKKCKYI